MKIMHPKFLNPRNGFLIIIIFIVAYWFGNEIYRHNKGTIITIAKIYDKEYFNGGFSFNFKYFYKGKEFKSGGTGSYFINNYNKLIYISIVKSNPKNINLVEFKIVPNCLTLEDAPPDGWSYIPDESICDSLKRNK